MKNKILVLAGSDKIGKMCINKIDAENFNVTVAMDCSSNIQRIYQILKKGSLSLDVFIKIIFADFLRKRQKIKLVSKVFSTDDLISILNNEKPDYVILFRCGLILNKKILERKEIFLNVHASSLPKYGGLGTIHSAIKDGSWNQNATLHRIITSIDQGKIIMEEPYLMNSNNSYFKNENIAYEAALKLLQKTIKSLANNSIEIK